MLSHSNEDVDLSIALGSEHAQGFFPDLKLHRTDADQLAVELDRNVFVTGNTQAFRLEILDLRYANFRAEKNFLEVTNDFEVTELFENDDVEQAVVDHGLFKKWEWTAVAPAISNEHEGAFHFLAIMRFDEKLRRLARGDLGRGNQITHRAEVFF